ncbi:MAG: hypothetical protein ABRQ27_11335 [Clostridiaceae bacterium]
MERVIKRLVSLIKGNLIELIIIFILAVVLINTLIMEPIVGKSNNGDFGRLLLYGGLGDLGQGYEEVYDGFVHKAYAFKPFGLLILFAANWISGTIILKIGIILSLVCNFFFSGISSMVCFNSLLGEGGTLFSSSMNISAFLFSDRGIFDIRYQTIIYCIIFTAGIYLILKNIHSSNFVKGICGVFILIFFTDINYIAYFNSFYGEAGTIVFFFLTIGTFLNLIKKTEPRKGDFIFFFIASVGFLTSKSQQIPLLLFALIIYYALYKYYGKYKKLIGISSICVVILCAGAYFSIDNYTNKNNIFQVVFNGVLNNSKDSGKDLQELGLDVKYAPLAGHGFYDKGMAFDVLGEDMLTNFYPKASRGKVIAFYIRHPERLWEQIDASAKCAYSFSPLNASNFEKDKFIADKPVNQLRVTLIEKYKELHRNPFVFISFSTLFFIVIVYCFVHFKERIVRLLMTMQLFILAAGASQLVLPVLGSGQSDFGKHLFLLNLSYDIMIGISVIWVSHLILKFISYISLQKRRGKYHERSCA